MALLPEEHHPYGRVIDFRFPDVKEKTREKTSNLLYLVSIPVGLLIFE